MPSPTTERSVVEEGRHTIVGKITFDPRPMRRAIARVRHSLGQMNIVFASSGRERGRRELRLGQELAADYPGEWEVFCVTTNEGHCRVISRPRGGWA